MARNHARIWLDINADDDFEALPFDAQGFYCRVILTLDDLNYCGVADWKPRKLTTKAPDLTYPRILTAASALETGRYCLFDLATEEVLARSFIRRDELLRNPTMAASVVKAYAGIASKTLRAAVVTEIRRVREEHPEYSSWSATIKGYDVGKALSKLLGKPCLDEVPYTDQIVVPITNTEPVAIGNTEPVPMGNPGPVLISNTRTVSNTDPIGNTKSVANPCTYTSTFTPAPLEGGYVTGVRHQAADPDPDDPPPPHCPKHPGGTDTPCRACGAARQQREAWDANQAKFEVGRRAAFRAEIANCPDCDDHGWSDTDTGVTRCTRHDWETTHA